MIDMVDWYNNTVTMFEYIAYGVGMFVLMGVTVMIMSIVMKEDEE